MCNYIQICAKKKNRCKTALRAFVWINCRHKKVFQPHPCDQFWQNIAPKAFHRFENKIGKAFRLYTVTKNKHNEIVIIVVFIIFSSNWDIIVSNTPLIIDSTSFHWVKIDPTSPFSLWISERKENIPKVIFCAT